MLVSDIITEIITEIGGDTDDTDLATRLLVFFKSGFRLLPAFARDRSFLGEGTLTLSSGEFEHSLNDLTGFIRERNVWYVNDTNTRTPIYKPPSPSYFQNIITPIATGNPFHYRIYGTTFQVDRKASRDFTIGFDYFKAVSAIAASDTFSYNEQIVQAAKYLCKAEYYGDYEEDEAKAVRNMNKGMAIAQILEEEFEVQELGGYVNESHSNDGG